MSQSKASGEDFGEKRFLKYRSNTRRCKNHQCHKIRYQVKRRVNQQIERMIDNRQVCDRNCKGDRQEIYRDTNQEHKKQRAIS